MLKHSCEINSSHMRRLIIERELPATRPLNWQPQPLSSLHLNPPAESYIDDNKRAKWCPSVPHCGHAVRCKEPHCEVGRMGVGGKGYAMVSFQLGVIAAGIRRPKTGQFVACPADTQLTPADLPVLLSPHISLAQVECTCGHQFCFACCEVPHSPCTCDMLRDWEQVGRDCWAR